MTARHVGISLGNLKRLEGGLGEVADRLGRTLAARAAQIRAELGICLHFHTTPELKGYFGDGVGYLPVHRYQEWWHPSSQRMDVWHVLNQLNRYRPPRSAGRTLVTVHDLNYLYEKQGLSRWRHGWRMRSLLARTDAVATDTAHVAGDLHRALNWQGPLNVIHLGVRDLRAVEQTIVSGLPEGYFLHLSRMTPSKNVEALLQMMAAWPERHLVLAGPSQVRNAELTSSAQALGLRNLTVLSAVSDSQKAWLYANCGAFFFPSLTEGFGLPPLEAMHFGKPVFLANLTSLPEVGGNAALYWEDFDPARMRAVVEAGLAGWSPDRSRAAVERAASFNWNRAAEQYIQQYLLLLDARFEDGKTACRAGS